MSPNSSDDALQRLQIQFPANAVTCYRLACPIRFTGTSPQRHRVVRCCLYRNEQQRPLQILPQLNHHGRPCRKKGDTSHHYSHSPPPSQVISAASSQCIRWNPQCRHPQDACCGWHFGLHWPSAPVSQSFYFSGFTRCRRHHPWPSPNRPQPPPRQPPRHPHRLFRTMANSCTRIFPTIPKPAPGPFRLI